MRVLLFPVTSLSHCSVCIKQRHRGKSDRNCFNPLLQGWWIQETKPRRNGVIAKSSDIYERSLFSQAPVVASLSWSRVCLRTRAKTSKHLVCWALQQAIQQFWQLFLSAAQEEASQSQLGLSGIRSPQVLQHTLTQGTKQPSPPSFIPTTGTHLPQAAAQDIGHQEQSQWWL